MKKKREIKKRLEDFIKDETGYISKDKILKIGVGTISVLGIMSAFSSNAVAVHTSHAAHSNTATIGGTTAPCPDITHSSHASHGSHDSY